MRQSSSTDGSDGDQVDRFLDASGTLCPIPVVRTGQALKQMAHGQVLEVLATDPLAELDLAVFCQHTGHELIISETVDDQVRVRIRKRQAEN
jgi:tRNA 2-thiouridine synthesizing protein A